MALEDIFRALEEQAEQECQQILEDARGQSDAILEEAQEQAEEIRNKLVTETEKATRLTASQSINSSRLENKKKVAAIKQDAVVGVFDKVLQKAQDLRGSSSYEAKFKVLVEEAIEGLEGDVQLLVDPADADLASRTLSKMGVSGEVKPEISTSGGVVAVTGGGRIMRRNTIEDRLEKIEPRIQADVAEILFS